MNPDSQLPLCCPCGSPDLYRRGLCQPCYNRGRHLCRVCQASTPLVVHHRRPATRPSALITLCRGCHARLHRLRAIDRWVPDLLGKLWAEQHPRSPRQLQLPAAFLG